MANLRAEKQRCYVRLTSSSAMSRLGVRPARQAEEEVTNMLLRQSESEQGRQEANRGKTMSSKSNQVRRSGLMIMIWMIVQQQQVLAGSFDDVILGGQQETKLAFRDELRSSLPVFVKPPQELPELEANFEVAKYGNLLEAIKAHPQLQSFAQLCKQKQVEEIVSLRQSAVTVFAPIDGTMRDLLTKSDKRRINLGELAKHHIVQGNSFVLDESTKGALQIFTATQSSPLYIQQTERGLFVNNARILATHRIAIDQDNYHTLHLIDQPLDYAYKTIRRKHQALKLPLSLDDLWNPSEPDVQKTLAEYQANFSDIQSDLLGADLLHARAYKDGAHQERIRLEPAEFRFERLARAIQSQPQLREKLFDVGASRSLNTYFVPIDSADSLRELLGQPDGLALEAHVIPNQVLFTRALGLGQPQASLFDQSSASHRVSLSLAKQLPRADLADDSHASDRALATPLLVQSRCVARREAGEASDRWRSGVVSAEVVLANFPLTTGVAHFIRGPLLVARTRLLDYINDSDNALTSITESQGSQTGSEPASLNHFRNLLARERHLLASQDGNLTVLAPSDDAFERLRYDLRALVTGDEALVPRHWNAAYKQELLERLVRRHVVVGQTLTSDLLERSGKCEHLSDNGKPLCFKITSSGQLQVESDSSRATFVHHDLTGSNGVLHIIDHVLGEEQETVHTLLEALKLRPPGPDPVASLQQLVQAGLRAQPPSQALEEGAGEKQELASIAGTIAGFLSEPEQAPGAALSSSVNLSCQLGRSIGLDWSEKFRASDKEFTLLVPSDLAWLALQRDHPELYRPLMHFLDQAGAESDAGADQPALKQARQARSSESGQRLRQILERHLVVGRQVAPEEMNRLDSLETLGATLRLVPQSSVNSNSFHHQLTEDAHNAAIQPAALHSIHAPSPSTTGNRPFTRTIRLADSASFANIVQANGSSNGYVYIIDHVLLQPDDVRHLLQTSSAPAIASTIFFGPRNSAILDFIQHLVAPGSFMSAQSVLALIGTLTFAIAALLVLALVLVLRRRRQNKLNRHQQLESGLTSSSSASQTGSTSTTKSL